MFNCDCYIRFHCIVCNGCVASFNFFYCVVVYTFVTLLEWHSWELNVTRCIIAYSFKSLTFWIFKNEAEFVGFKLTAFQTFSEVEFYFNWNVINTFFSWFAWFFNFLSCWVVVVYNLSRSIFNIHTTRYISFHFCWDVELVVTSKCEFSCVDHLCVFCVAKWLSEAIFKGCSDHTVVHSDIEFICYFCACYWIVSFDLSRIKFQLSFIVVIWDSYWLDVVLVRCVEFSCIQPYLVNQLVATFNSLGIQVLSFVVWCIVRIWVRICICVLVCQLFIVINELVTCDIEFLFRNNIFLWLEFRFFWRTNSIVELFISDCSYSCYKGFSRTIVWYCDCYSSFHCIVSNGCVWAFNFFYCVVVNTFVTLLEFKSFELNVTRCIVAYSFKSLTFWIFKHEAEFVGFKFTAFQAFCEVEFYFNWNVVYTFFSWFAWFFNFLSSWVVVVDYLSRSIFNIHTTRYISFHCCWDVELVVTSKCEFSCVDHLCVFCVAKWLSEAIFKGCSDHTVVHSDIEFICYFCACYWIVSFDLSRIKFQLSFIVVIWDSYWLDVVLVRCVEFSCIQPYLVNQLVATFNSLGIQVLFFVVWCIVRIWVRICICVLVCQLFIIINELVTSDIEFLFRNNIFLWLELRFFWRSYTVVKFFIRNVAYSCHKNFSSTIVFNCDCYIRFHCVVCNGCVWAFNFFYSVVVNTFVTLLEFKSFELNVTRCIVAYSFKSLTFWIFKHEAEFVGFKFTAFQAFCEVEFYFNWNVVYTFFSWFAWFFNFLSSWVVVVDYLSRSIFNIHTTRYISFHCCWDVELVVTSKCEFSCVDDLCVFCIAKWLREAIFKGCSDHTVVHSDIEFICYFCACYWIVSFDLSRIKFQLSFIVVIWDSYWLDVVLVRCVEFSCIQPYLVNQLVATFNSLGIQVLSFVVWCIVRIWVRICICVLVCQLFIVINELVTCDIEFLFRNNIFLWLEFRFFWRTNSIVELFISRICHVCDQGFRCTIMTNFNCNDSFHCIVCNGCVWAFNFFYCVLVGTFLTLLVFKGSDSFTSFIGVLYWSKLDLTSFVVGCRCDHNIVAIFQLECEFVSFKRTAFQFLSEVEFYWDWNTVDTFFSWFVWFFNSLTYWVVVVHNLSCFVFNIRTSYDIVFHCCWDIKFIVASKFELSCINDLSVFSVAKWLSEACFQVRCQNTVVIRDIEFSCYICTSNWIVNLDIWSINRQFILVVVICDTYCLDVIFVVCVKFSCIQPYLVVKFRSTFNCLSIQVFSFVVVCIIDIWICVCFTIFICQFRIVINELSTSDIEFRFRNNVFLWLELRFCWWSDTVVEFFIGRFCHVCDQGFRSTIMTDFNSYNCSHWVVSNSWVCTLNLCYSVSVSTFLTLLVFKGSDSFTSFICVVNWSELEVTACVVGCSRNHNIVAIFQLECEFASFKVATFQFLSEVKFYWDWNIVYPFFSWFFRFFNFLSRWVVVVYNLSRSIFDICTSYNIVFHCCWDVELVVTSKCEFSCVDDLCVFCIAKWLREASFQVSSDHTVVDSDIEFICYFCACYRVIGFDVSFIKI